MAINEHGNKNPSDDLMLPNNALRKLFLRMFDKTGGLRYLLSKLFQFYCMLHDASSLVLVKGTCFFRIHSPAAAILKLS